MPRIAESGSCDLSRALEDHRLFRVAKKFPGARSTGKHRAGGQTARRFASRRSRIGATGSVGPEPGGDQPARDGTGSADLAEPVRDHSGQTLAFVYCEDEPGRRAAAKLLTRDGARRIAGNIATLPDYRLTGASDCTPHHCAARPDGGGRAKGKGARSPTPGLRMWCFTSCRPWRPRHQSGGRWRPSSLFHWSARA